MAQVDDLAEALGENVGEVVPLDDLFVAALVHDKEEVEAALAAVDHADLVVAPFVVRVLVHRVVALVHHVDEAEAPRTSLDQEGELNWVVGWQRHEVCDVFVGGIGVLELDVLF